MTNRYHTKCYHLCLRSVHPSTYSRIATTTITNFLFYLNCRKVCDYWVTDLTPSNIHFVFQWTKFGNALCAGNRPSWNVSLGFYLNKVIVWDQILEKTRIVKCAGQFIELLTLKKNAICCFQSITNIDRWLVIKKVVFLFLKFGDDLKGLSQFICVVGFVVCGLRVVSAIREEWRLCSEEWNESVTVGAKSNRVLCIERRVPVLFLSLLILFIWFILLFARSI